MPSPTSLIYSKCQRANIVKWYRHFMQLQHPYYRPASWLRAWAINAAKQRYDMRYIAKVNGR